MLERAVHLGRRARHGNWLTQLVVTRRCNLSCGYCNEYDQVSKPVPTETLKRAIDKLHQLGTFTLEMTGGEPLMHPDVIALFDYARDVGIPRRRIITNGFFLTRPIIEELNRVELFNMQISIDGIHRNEVTEKVLDNLKKRLVLLREHARFRVTIGVVIGSTNFDEADQLTDYALAQGFVVNLNILHDGEGQLELPRAQLDKYEELVTRVHGPQFDFAGDYRYRLVTGADADFRCRAGSRYLYVDEFQNVVWCSQTRFDGFKKSLFDYDWDDMAAGFHTDKSCSKMCTVGCARRVSRLDEWRPIGDQPYRAAIPDIPLARLRDAAKSLVRAGRG